MSTAIPAPAPAAPAREIRQPLLWLLAIIAVGLALRGMYIKRGFQQEEFASLAAVAERQGVPSAAPGVAEAYTPTAENPLVPVASAAEVSRRSVIPFGVQDPVPLYHYVLWGVIHVLPVDDWSLRLPSLVASVLCIVAVFFLCRHLFGTEMALVAALFVAVEPIQVATGWMARPYAIANLAVVLSFAALWGLLHTRKPAVGAVLALAYAACLAVIGYMNPLLLLVVVAHLGMVVYAWVQGGEGLGWKTALTVLGVVLGVGALAPELGYVGQLYGFVNGHRAYLVGSEQTLPDGRKTWENGIYPLNFLTVLWHNLAFIGGLLLVLAAGALVRMHLQGGGTEEKPGGEAAAPSSAGGDEPAGGVTAVKAAAPAAAPAAAEVRPELQSDPLPDNDEGLWMGRLWLFLPLAIAVVLTFTLAMPILQTRFLTYTTLAAAILLAYYATRDASREVRLAVSGVVGVALLAFGFAPTWSLGDGRLFSSDKARAIMAEEGGFGTKMAPVWKEGDVILMRSALPESDFLRNDIPAENRPQVERAMLAPLTLLYPDTTNKPVVALTLSQYRNKSVKTAEADQVNLSDYYNADFVARLKQYKRYWMTGVGPGEAPNSWWYLACVVPWMATQLNEELLLARNRDQASGERYITVKPGLGLDEPIKGLAPKPGSPVEDLQKKDFDNFVHIVKPKEEKK